MEITQSKLTKLEWESIEIPVSEEEKEILLLIKNGFSDPNVSYNKTSSLFNILKIDKSEHLDAFLFNYYLVSALQSANKTIDIDLPVFNEKKIVIKKMTRMKLENSNSTLDSKKKYIYEFIIIDIINLMARAIQKNSHDYVTHFYTLFKMIQLNIANKNSVLVDYCNSIFSKYQGDINYLNVIKNGYNIIENNHYLNNYGDIKLFDHQRRIFSIFNQPSEEARLTLYIAPTATGKTLTPIGLSNKYKIIFICAARHVGLALAKSAISIGKKVALAFNCDDASGIRLHYYAATDYTVDWRSGGIRKVDNSVGDKVEIMICDVKSYISAMYYMMSFTPDTNNIITYWDEPTISMDEEEHELHSLIQRNWQQNQIRNVVLSSATLPKEEEIRETISDFRSRFQGNVHSIVSHDCKKSIPITDADCYTCLPHLLWKDSEQLMNSVTHCIQNKTLLRYFDLQSIIDFVIYANVTDGIITNQRYEVANYFESIFDINMTNVKMYYLDILNNIDIEQWDTIYKHFQSRKKKNYASNTKMVTEDAHTLTDGPSIFLTEDISKVAKVCIKTANIPQQVMSDLNESIAFNNKLNEELKKLEHSFEDMLNKLDISEDSNKMTKDRFTPEMKTLRRKIDEMRNITKVIKLHDMFIPNRKEHISKWTKDKLTSKPFTCNISEHHVIKIMELDNVNDSWKILLLMGIGVFTEHNSIDYTEIMKELAREQKLFMIIASSNYIYGTNYQFCHGYIGKDMSAKMTQEKCIQAMGRVGRNKIQQTYSVRFRDNELIKRLLLPEENKIEVRIMNRLFNSEE